MLFASIEVTFIKLILTSITTGWNILIGQSDIPSCSKITLFINYYLNTLKYIKYGQVKPKKAIIYNRKDHTKYFMH